MARSLCLGSSQGLGGGYVLKWVFFGDTVFILLDVGCVGHHEKKAEESKRLEAELNVHGGKVDG